MNYTYLQIAKTIDHSLLNPSLSADELESGIQLALDYDVASVCIMPYYLKRCASTGGERSAGIDDDRLSAWRAHDRRQASRSRAGNRGRLRGTRHGDQHLAGT